MIPQTRLATLRKLNRLTQTEFAQRLGVTQPLISQLERGMKPLPQPLAHTATTTFHVPDTFFTPPPTPPLGIPTYRKTARTSTHDTAYVDALFTEAARAFATISAESDYPETHLPEPSHPEDTALAIRELAALTPDEPIRNITRLAERLGIGVIAQLTEPTFTTGHEGASMPTRHNRRPLIATTTPSTSGDRHRFSIAHELGHLIFDHDRETPIHGPTSPEERRAHHFAGALLYPANIAQHEITETLPLHAYLHIKATYGISVAALILRARTLGLISESRARSLQIQRVSAGWRTSEPVTVELEEPALFGQALRHVYTSHARAATALGISPTLLQRWAPEPETPHTATIIDLAAHRTPLTQPATPPQHAATHPA